MLVNDERLKKLLYAAGFLCVDLNYNLFGKKSCHDECYDCPLESVESMIEWLRKEDNHEKSFKDMQI